VPLKRNRCLAVLVVFFLIQYVVPSEILSGNNFPLPQIRTGADSVDTLFKPIYESICVGLTIYKLDTIGHYTKEKIMTNSRAGAGNLVRFDMDNIDVGKKGWTRYYPFSIGEKNFIMRIFLTQELQYQPKVKVLYEGTIEDPAVTFQILPSLNELLSDCSIKPIRIHSTSRVDSSS